MASGDEQYHPKDAVKAAINGTLITGAAGLAVSAIQNTLTKRNLSAWGVFTRTGGTIAVFGNLLLLPIYLELELTFYSRYGRLIRIFETCICEFA